MKFDTKFTGAGLMALAALFCSPSNAALPNCQNAGSDPDGDGFGWENNSSCQVVASATTSSGSRICSSASADPDGDGYGWENNSSCIVSAGQSASGSNDTMAGSVTVCTSAASDPDGDGYGWENNQSCMVDSSNNTAPADDAPSGSLPSCANTSSDPDGDGFGWENNQSCMVVSSNSTPEPANDAPSGSLPACANTSSDPDGDGFGWENNASCQVTSATAPIGVPSNAGSGSSDMGQNGGLNNAGSGSADMGETVGQNNAGSGSADMGQGGSAGDFISNDGGNFSSADNSGSIVRTSSLDSAGSQEICTQSGGDWFGWMTVGDFILHNNTWAAWASNDYNWRQCIYTNQNGAKAGIYYDWGPGRGPGDFQVRSYPELVFGIKDEYRGMPKSVTGLPERVNNLPAITIDYSMNWPEYGPARSVQASANPRYPNGTQIQGERNVSIESFFYNPDENGECSEGIVRRGNGSNHTYEVMVWLNAGAERLPAGPSDYVTDVTLDNATYKVYTKNNDRKYIAFVAQNPQQTGILYWNTFLDWTALNAHRVQALYGARTNSVAFQQGWCMGNLLVGTEVFWGEGNLDFIDWKITQRR